MVRREGGRLGPYELVAVLGRGGMGEVWEAVLHGPGGFRKTVALKLLLPQAVEDPEVHRSFLREARLGAMLQHPNVVGTLGVSEHDGTWVVALELVRGASTSELMRATGPLGPRALVELGVQAAAGLAHCHEAGLVHRDVKPANLLVDRSGLVKLADLGISLLGGEPGQPAGTPGYLAPEQIHGRPEPRSDLFSLAVSLLSLATGTRPFGSGASAVAAALEVDQRLQAGLCAPLEAVSPGLRAVLEACLRGDPERRPRDARELAERLASLRVEHPDGPALVALLARARPGLTVDQAPTPSADAATRLFVVGNLRPPRDRFVGRQDEVAGLRTVVEQGPGLVSLLGPGGAGKTRVALEVARRVRPGLPGGASAFDLSEARTSEAVCAVLAQAMGLVLDRRDPVAQLGRVFAGAGRSLVLLDNLEQCVAHLPDTLGRWLELAPEATFLGTSRVVLGLSGERPVSLGELSAADAAALFRERVGRALTPEEEADVGPICALLEGVPLAVELAAARVRLIGVARVRARVSLPFLAGGRAELPPRQRSVAASLDWSYELLAPVGRAALEQLAVFESGFLLEAAEAVLEVPGAVDALQVLQELVDASLLRVDGRTGRFSMLVVVREYAAGRSGAARAGAELRHGAHYAQLGRREVLEGLRRRDGSARRRAQAAELDNLVAACERAVLREDPRIAVATLRAAFAVLRPQGSLGRAGALAARVAGLGGGTLVERSDAWRIAGLAAVLSSDLATGAPRLEQAAAWAREAGDVPREGVLGYELGHVDQVQGRFDAAQARYERSLAQLRSVGDLGGEANALGQLGLLHKQRGRFDASRDCTERALELHRRVGDRRGEAVDLGMLGLLEQRAGRLPLAQAHHEASLLLYRELGERGSEATSLTNLGILHQILGDNASAVRCFEQAAACAEDTGETTGRGQVLANLSTLHLEEGRLDEALANAETWLGLSRAAGDGWATGMALAHLGAVRRQRGEAELARMAGLQGLEVAAVAGDATTMGFAFKLLGELLLEQGRPVEASTAFDEGLARAREAQDPCLEGRLAARLVLARVRARIEDPARALSSLGESEDLIRGSGEPNELGEVLVVRAELSFRAGDPLAAAAALSRAEPYAARRSDVRRELAQLREAGFGAS